MKTNQTIGILSLSIGLFSFLITTNDQLDCNILISLLLEEKSLKIASKLGFLAPGLEKWTKVVQARILVKNGRSSTPAGETPPSHPFPLPWQSRTPQWPTCRWTQCSLRLSWWCPTHSWLPPFSIWNLKLFNCFLNEVRLIQVESQKYCQHSTKYTR